MRTRFPKGVAVGAVLIGVAWTGAVAALVPVVRSLYGDFKFDRPAVAARGALVRVGGDSMAPLLLDTTTALVIVYSSTCSQCKANTDNWLRLTNEMHVRHPGVPLIVVATPATSNGQPDLPPALGRVWSEYRFVSGDVASSFRTNFVPATIVIRHGRIDLAAYGVVGDRRRARLVAAFDGVEQ